MYMDKIALLLFKHVIVVEMGQREFSHYMDAYVMDNMTNAILHKTNRVKP